MKKLSLFLLIATVATNEYAVASQNEHKLLKESASIQCDDGTKLGRVSNPKTKTLLGRVWHGVKNHKLEIGVGALCLTGGFVSGWNARAAYNAPTNSSPAPDPQPACTPMNNTAPFPPLTFSACDPEMATACLPGNQTIGKRRYSQAACIGVAWSDPVGVYYYTQQPVQCPANPAALVADLEQQALDAVAPSLNPDVQIALCTVDESALSSEIPCENSMNGYTLDTIMFVITQLEAQKPVPPTPYCNQTTPNQPKVRKKKPSKAVRSLLRKTLQTKPKNPLLTTHAIKRNNNRPQGKKNVQG